MLYNKHVHCQQASRVGHHFSFDGKTYNESTKFRGRENNGRGIWVIQ